MHEDGSTFGCQVAHAALKKSGFSSIGEIRAAAFDVSEGRIGGHFTTDCEKTSFDETWSVDLKFVVPFKTQAPAEQPLTSSSKPASSDSVASKSKSKPASGRPADASAAVSVYDLPFPADAANIEFRARTRLGKETVSGRPGLRQARRLTIRRSP